MKTVIRAIGNSQGITIPKPLLVELGMSVGDAVELALTGDSLVMTKPADTYSLAKLVAQCDLNAPVPADILAWQTLLSVGKETF